MSETVPTFVKQNIIMQTIIINIVDRNAEGMVKHGSGDLLY